MRSFICLFSVPLRGVLFVFLLAIFRLTVSGTPTDLIGKTAPDVQIEEYGGGHCKLSDFRGKWVLYERGAISCRPAELVADVFSLLQRVLHDQPFQFVESLSDFTSEDVEAFSLVRFSGRRGVIADGADADAYDYPSIPNYYLIDPQGTIRLVGHHSDDPKELRTAILAALHKGGFPQEAGNTELSADDAAWEVVLQQESLEDHQAQYAAIEPLRLRLPDDQQILSHWALSASYVIGLDKTVDILKGTSENLI